jgi:hypothetical protein
LYRLRCFSSSLGIALSRVRVELNIALALKSSLRRLVSSCIFPFFLDLCTLIYLFYLVSILSFNACIVTITWAYLCVVISLCVTYLAFVVLFSLGLVEDRVIEVRVSLYKFYENSRNYSWMWCPGLIATLKVCVFARIVVVPA